MDLIVFRGKVLKTPELEKKWRREKRTRLFVYLIFVLLITAFIIFCLRHPNFVISSIQVEGTKVVSSETVEERVLEKLGGKYLWLVPKASALIYQYAGIESTLMEEIPRFESVDTSLINPRTLAVRVVEREPLGLYCTNVQNFSAPDDCYFIDESGFIFSKAPWFSGIVYFVYNAADLTEDPVGKQFMDKRKFREINEFKDGLANLGIKAQMFKITGDEYSLIFPNEARLVWRGIDDVGEVRSNLEAFLLADAIRTQKDFLDRLLYLDLSYQNKIFYKLR